MLIPSSVVKCLWGVFVLGFGVLFSVGVCVCVCDLLHFLLIGRETNIGLEGARGRIRSPGWRPPSGPARGGGAGWGYLMQFELRARA